jgi:DNA-binding MarR family transcriptional regulator
LTPANRRETGERYPRSRTPPPKLVERGDVERLPNPEDGRSHVLRVTKRGDGRWRAGWPALQATVRDIESNLEREPDDVHDALEDLLAALRAASRTLNTVP